MSRKTKIIGASILLFALIGFASVYYVFNGGARNLATEATEFTVTSTTILAEFTQNPQNKKYLDKAVAISGTVTAVSPTEVTLDGSIICALSAPEPTIKMDQKVTIKGRVVGFDDLLGELKLDQSGQIE
jgi:hypothetical protein